MTEKSVKSKYYDVFKIFIKHLDKNINKEKEYLNAISKNAGTQNILYLNEDCKSLNSIEENSIDLVITSPPYGDSHTTVAYGQFSKLSNDLLGLSEITNIDKVLLGGKNVKNRCIEDLKSDTLCDIYKKIYEVDSKRAREVLDFYFDLDDCLKAISQRTKKDGYQFWVVGNRTVKKHNIPTDRIIEEMGMKYNLITLTKFYRTISNKVMPSLNSPTNKTGELVSTMCDEIILFLKKI